MKDYIEERALDIADYIINEKATVRQTATIFGVSKSTVHTVVFKMNVINLYLKYTPKLLKYKNEIKIKQLSLVKVVSF